MVEMAELRRQVPKLALKASFRGKPLRELARRVVHIARDGLDPPAQTRPHGRR